MNEEFQLHVELRAQDYERSGLPAPQALRRARQEFGSPARYQEEARESRGLHRIDWVRFSWLDFKLGFRMLARFPGLTLVGCVAMAVAIALGSLYFEMVNKFLNPRIPLAAGDRIVGIQNWNVASAGADARSLHDYAVWREQLRSVDDVGAAVRFDRNLRTEDGNIETVRGVEMSASAFRVARTKPLLGRPLLDADEQLDAPAVVVLSYRLWQSRFAGDPVVVGRTVKLGSTDATVVGVMPQGFGFPVAERIWTPLRVKVSDFERGEGPGLQVIGRLAAGVSLEQAQAELDGLGLRAAADYPATNKDVRPRVAPYAVQLVSGAQMQQITRILYSINIVFALLLVVVCANVATLVFARTATRAWEITVRNALGASRGRIVTQLFVEALVLTSLATVLGLLIAGFAMRYGITMIQASQVALPFWMNSQLSPATVLYAVLLTLLGAAIVGILPALRVTGKNVEAALRRAAADRSGLRFGGFWTGIIVAQVAITVAFIPLALGGVRESNRFQRRADAIQAEYFLSAELDLVPEMVARDSSEAAAFMARARATYEEIERGLRADRTVEHVSFANRLPGMDQFKYGIEVDSVLSDSSGLRRTTAASVSPSYFAAFGTKLVAGRAFEPLDIENDRVVIVNQAFVHHVLADRNPIGRRLRYTGGGEDDKDTEKWYEIVGVVKNGGWLPADQPVEASAVYHPMAPGTGNVRMALRLRGDPEAMAPRLRAIVVAVDPTIRLSNVVPLAQIGGGEARINWLLTSVAALVAFIVMLLSATGIHSLMAFTVAKRVREIGIRMALGAHPRRIVAGIFSRAFLQLGLGVIVGSAVAALAGGIDTVNDIATLLAAVSVMMVIGLLACAVPLRRALTIHPTEALRGDG